MTEQEVIARLRVEVKEAGSLRAFAGKHGITASYIHDILHGRRAVSDRIASAIGIRRVVTVTYEYHEVT